MVQLFRQNSAPHQIALGAGIGAFICILPLYGLHTVLMILAMFLVRSANRVAIFLGTNISLPPTIPLITWGAYVIGRALVGKDLPVLNREFFKSITLEKLAGLYWPLFLGSVILGLVCALVTFSFTYFAVKWIKQKRSDAAGKQNNL